MGEVLSCSNGDVGRVVAWHDDCGWEPRECVRDAFGGGRLCPDYVATIVPQGLADIPSSNDMWEARSMSRGFIVDEDLRLWRSKRIVIEVETHR
jgi:hypothetical protein